MRLPIPLRHCRQRNSTCTRHVSYTGHPLITVAVTTGDAFAAAFTGCGVVRAAQRFVAQEMPGHAATAGKMRWPRQAMA